MARPKSFQSGATPNYPDTSVNAVALVIAESRLLADALAAPTANAMRERALTALAARAHRCRIVGSRECALERDLERNEGTATYVAAALVSADANSRGLDSLRALLAGFADLTRLGRWHFYDTGLAWLILLDRLGPETWKPAVEVAAPDSILASHLRLSSEHADSTWTGVAATPLWPDARHIAERLITRELALRDSVHRAFWAQRGTLIKVYWKMVESMSIEPRPLPGHVVRGFTVSDSLRGEMSYAIGLAESTVRLDSRANWIRLRGQSASVHGSNPAFLAIVSVTGRTARVGDRVIPLDRAVAALYGQISFQLDHIDVMLENASLEMFADSVIVRMR
jgi:hypothetical protein